MAIYMWKDVNQLDFCYTWDAQSVSLPAWSYKLQVWWAEGGYYTWGSASGKWGYAEWCITLNNATCLYIYVGWTWAATNTNNWQNAWWFNWWWAGYNYSTNYIWTWGWWGTDIRIWWNTLYHRRIVAGWGWWWWYYPSCSSMCWWVGWWACWIWWWAYGSYPWWGWWTQTSWWTNSYFCNMVAWSFWQGWYKTNWTSWYNWSWGWWWWYWGWAWAAVSAWWWGWSWYIYTSTSSVPSWYCTCSAYYICNGHTCLWNTVIPSPSWWTETWHSGNGCVIITQI